MYAHSAKRVNRENVKKTYERVNPHSRNTLLRGWTLCGENRLCVLQMISTIFSCMSTCGKMVNGNYAGSIPEFLENEESNTQ